MIPEEKAFTLALGKELQQFRQQKDLTLDQVIVEASLSISRSSLSAVENGNQSISARDLYALSVLYDVSLSDLMNKVMVDILEQKYSVDLSR